MHSLCRIAASQFVKCMLLLFTQHLPARILLGRRFATFSRHLSHLFIYAYAFRKDFPIFLTLEKCYSIARFSSRYSHGFISIVIRRWCFDADATIFRISNELIIISRFFHGRAFQILFISCFSTIYYKDEIIRHTTIASLIGDILRTY